MYLLRQTLYSTHTFRDWEQCGEKMYVEKQAQIIGNMVQSFRKSTLFLLDDVFVFFFLKKKCF
jgi:hypothetical protein